MRGGAYIPDGNSEFLHTEGAINQLYGRSLSDTSSLSNVASSASNVTLLASNRARRGYKIFNDSTQILYVKEGATASTTSFSYRLTPQGFYESGACVYRGVIDGIWGSANGSARVTELS